MIITLIDTLDLYLALAPKSKSENHTYLIYETSSGLFVRTVSIFLTAEHADWDSSVNEVRWDRSLRNVGEPVLLMSRCLEYRKRERSGEGFC